MCGEVPETFEKEGAVKLFDENHQAKPPYSPLRDALLFAAGRH